MSRLLEPLKRFLWISVFLFKLQHVVSRQRKVTKDCIIGYGQLRCLWIDAAFFRVTGEIRALVFGLMILEKGMCWQVEEEANDDNGPRFASSETSCIWRNFSRSGGTRTIWNDEWLRESFLAADDEEERTQMKSLHWVGQAAIDKGQGTSESCPKEEGPVCVMTSRNDSSPKTWTH